MDSVTISDNDFKTIHNALCDLRWIVEAMDQTVIKTERFENIVKRFEQGLKSAYEQENSDWDRKYEYYGRFRKDNRLNAIWSVFNLPEHGFLKDHPWQGAKTLEYKGAIVTIPGTTWADLYQAADIVIQESGDDHHIFIEGFYPKGDELRLTTGS